ncbi:MAG: hypothetical protein KJ967_04260 [Elusimicrobia bacterium]|nr:hypothetical protein [Elusimicrobiota bacterium]
MIKKHKGYFFATVSVFIVALVYIFEQVEAQRTLNRLEALHKEKSKTLQDLSDLQITLSGLKSLGKLEQHAKEMKFCELPENRVIYINEKNK